MNKLNRQKRQTTKINVAEMPMVKAVEAQRKLERKLQEKLLREKARRKAEEDRDIPPVVIGSPQQGPSPLQQANNRFF